MEVNPHENSKLVEVWLTKAERTDPVAQAKLREVTRYYSAQKCMVAVFLSGTQDLEEETGALLLYNRRRSAEQEVQRKKKQKTRECR